MSAGSGLSGTTSGRISGETVTRRVRFEPGSIDPSARLDVIELGDLQVRCIVGVYPSEKSTPQPLEVSLALHLDTRAAARNESLRHTVDYARLAGELRFLLEHCRFRLLETAAHALARYVLAPPLPEAPRARVLAVDVTLRKPRALGGEGVPRLTVHRRAVDEEYEVETQDFGEVDVVHEHPGCGIYRLRVAPGRSIPTHLHRRMEESELVLGSGLLLQRQPVRAGSAFVWPHGLPHRYDNPTSQWQTILCVDRPSFDPADEVEVDEPKSGLQTLEGSDYYPRESTVEETPW